MSGHVGSAEAGYMAKAHAQCGGLPGWHVSVWGSVCDRAVDAAEELFRASKLGRIQDGRDEGWRADREGNKRRD